MLMEVMESGLNGRHAVEVAAVAPEYARGLVPTHHQKAKEKTVHTGGLGRR